jgi:uroporphyrinogen III methyltransferase/synthase
VRAAGLGAPAITVVGEVVRWRERIRWFDHPALRPLFGRRVLVTRARAQASDLAARLRLLGAEAVEAPLQRFAAPEATAPLDVALGALDRYGWIAFASANAVRFTWERLLALGRDARALGRARVAALGPGTAQALIERGIRADLVPAGGADSEALARALAAAPPPARLLLPQADNARPTLARALAQAGWEVDAVVAYRALPLEVDASGLEPLDAATFASSGTVERFHAAWGPEGIRRLLASGCRFYAIGSRTATTMTELGLPIAATAAEPSVEALVEAVVRDLARP